MSSPHMSQRRARLAGALLIAGAIVFWSGSFMPSSVVYMTPGLLEKIELIASHRTSWMLQHTLFLGGVIVTAMGLVVLATILRGTNARQFATDGLIAIVLATAVWAIATYFRVTVPAEEIVRTSDVPPLFLAALGGWMFVAFTVLTLGAFTVIGVALSQSGLLKRLGRIAAIVSGLMLLASIVLTFVWAVASDFRLSVPAGGWAPEVQYLVTSLIGIGLLRRQQAEPQPVGAAQGGHSTALQS